MKFPLSLGWSDTSTPQRDEIKHIEQFKNSSEFADYIAARIADAPATGPISDQVKHLSVWCTIGTFSMGKRKLQTPENTPLIWIDLDKPDLCTEFLRRISLKPILIPHVIFHTYSSTLTEPRLRIAIPIPTDTPPEKYARYWDRAIEDLDIEGADKASRSPSKIIYLPTTHPSEEVSGLTPASRLVSSNAFDNEPYRPTLPELIVPERLASDSPTEITPHIQQKVDRIIQTAIDRGDNEDRDSWAKFGMAIKWTYACDPDLGYEMFDRFSRGAPGYDEVENRIQWESFHIVRGEGQPVATLHTLERMYVDTSFHTDLMDSLKSSMDTFDTFDEWSEAEATQDAIRLLPMSKQDIMKVSAAANTAFPNSSWTKTELKSLVGAMKADSVVTRDKISGDELFEKIPDFIPAFNRTYFNCETEDYLIVRTRKEIDGIIEATVDSTQSVKTSYVLKDWTDSDITEDPDFKDIFTSENGVLSKTVLSNYIFQHSPTIQGTRFEPGLPPMIEMPSIRARFANTYRADLLPIPIPREDWTEEQQLLIRAFEALNEWRYPSARDRAVLYFFMGHVVKNPRTKLLWSLVNHSECQGIGKSLMYGMLRQVIGKSNAHVINAKQVAGDQYNDYLANNLLVCVEELEENTGSIFRVLKSAQTEESITIRTMYRDPREGRVYANFMMNTNALDKIDIDPNDRRNAILVLSQTEDDLFAFKKEFMATWVPRLTKHLELARWYKELQGSSLEEELPFRLADRLGREHPGVLATFLLEAHEEARLEHGISPARAPWTDAGKAFRTAFNNIPDALYARLRKEASAGKLPPVIDPNTFYKKLAIKQDLCSLEEWDNEEFNAKRADTITNKVMALVRKNNTGFKALKPVYGKPFRGCKEIGVPKKQITCYTSPNATTLDVEEFLEADTKVMTKMLDDWEYEYFQEGPKLRSV